MRTEFSKSELEKVSLYFGFKLELVANPVIEAKARMEFEDGLRTGFSWRLLVPLGRPHLS